MHDNASFDAFYDRTAADIARHVYLLTASPHRAAHVTHRAYARAYADWERVSTLPSPESWVRMLASDMALDHLHRAQQRVGGWIPRSDRLAAKLAKAGPKPADPQPTPATPPKDQPSEEEPPEEEPQKPRDNRSKKNGRKPRQDRPSTTTTGDPTPPPDVPAPDSPVPDLGDDKDDTVDRDWSADVALLRALRRVPAHRRRAAVLRHHLGMTPEDIAAETEATTNSTIERISLANEQLSRRVGELTGPDPDSNEAHERLHAVMADLTRRYRPKLHAASTVRTGARTRTVVLVAAVGAVILGLGGYALSSITDPGDLPDKRAEVRASIAARGAQGEQVGGQGPKQEFKFGRTNAKAEQVPQSQYEFVYIRGSSERDGGTFLTIEAAHAGVDPEAIIGVREVPLATQVRFRGEKAFGITEERFVDPKLFLSRLAEGHLANTIFQIHYDDNNQLDRVTEFRR